MGHYIPPNWNNTDTEEEVSAKKISKLDANRISPTISPAREVANTICRGRGANGFGVKRAIKFLKRAPAVRVRTGRAYECRKKGL